MEKNITVSFMRTFYFLIKLNKKERKKERHRIDTKLIEECAYLFIYLFLMSCSSQFLHKIIDARLSFLCFFFFLDFLWFLTRYQSHLSFSNYILTQYHQVLSEQLFGTKLVSISTKVSSLLTSFLSP